MNAPVLDDDPLSRADAAQRAASSPDHTVFVSASAGSGKTKVLTDRLLRLMLSGADPARIQCLTFTKAAAAEMAVRLQRRLGAWVTASDAALDGEFASLAVVPAAETRAAARQLFAKVLDLPGGIRIETIHAFCQSLLRRFPLEAQLSPHFRLLDQSDARTAIQSAHETVIASTDAHLLQRLSAFAQIEPVLTLVSRLHASRDRMPAGLESGAVDRAVGAPAMDEDTIVARAVEWAGADALHRALALIQNHDTAAKRRDAQAMSGWLNQPLPLRIATFDQWLALFFTQKGKPRALSEFVNEGVLAAWPETGTEITREQERLAAITDSRMARRLAGATSALLAIAREVTTQIEGWKQGGGWLDYSDLIARTTRLLIDPGAAWVLYKLDGGIDHLLLDEVQDTAPAQWEIAGRLTEEFFAGTGARDVTRTVFAVGDRKQSIFGFQGADPAEFDRWRHTFEVRANGAGLSFHHGTLDVSFRSTAPVLDLVDAIFNHPDAPKGVVAEGETLRHVARRAGHAGRVELWPLIEAPQADDIPPHAIPDRNAQAVTHVQRLAETVADWIAHATSGGERLESQARDMRPGDIMVLVRRRNAFPLALVRALKARGVPVMGLDRLVLTEPIAVQDLLALCDVLLLPADDLSLAAVLKSPLMGLDDDDLMALAIGRGEARLWDVLRTRAAERPEWRAAERRISTLLARVDYTSPHALLSEILGPMGGRARLLARLGPDAAEPVDELLSAALRYTQAFPPSLQGFLHWLWRSNAEITRQVEGAGDAVRVMTAHGAKGLQAPVVILPDTATAKGPVERMFWVPSPDDPERQLPLWAPNASMNAPALRRAKEQHAKESGQEYNRLLYVALTRAEDRLIVCGSHGERAPKEDDPCWYRACERGFRALSSRTARVDAIGLDVLVHDCPQIVAPLARPAAEAAPRAVIPSWAGHAPDWRPAALPPEPERPRPLAPSRPDGVEFGPVPPAASPMPGRDGSDAAAERLRRGTLAHALLQHLPELAPADRPAAAATFARRAGHGLADDTIGAVVDSVLAVMSHPDLAPLFGPASRAEQPIVGLIGERVISGQVDRLAVLSDRVLVADFKTGRAAPATLAATPARYLRQMAAYRAVLRGVFPGRRIISALIWTHDPAPRILPDDILDFHDPGASLDRPVPSAHVTVP